jgi:hypothetical protein
MDMALFLWGNGEWIGFMGRKLNPDSFLPRKNPSGQHYRSAMSIKRKKPNISTQFKNPHRAEKKFINQYLKLLEDYFENKIPYRKIEKFLKNHEKWQRERLEFDLKAWTGKNYKLELSQRLNAQLDMVNGPIRSVHKGHLIG